MDLDALEPLVGRWTTSAVMPAGGATVAGRTSFRWLDRGGYLIQHAAMDDPVFPTGVMVLGPSASGSLVQHYFDSRGVARVYGVSLAGGIWTLWREDPADFSQRFTGTFSADGARIDGSWEKDLGAGWEHDFDLTYTRD